MQGIHRVAALASALSLIVIASACSSDSPAPTYTLSGTITGASSVTVNLTVAATTGTTVTDGSGRYSFSGLANGTYTVTPAKDGYTFTPPNRTVTVNGANVDAQDFTATQMPSCRPDVAVGAGLFSSPPTDIANVGGIVPLGNMNPSGGHVLAVNHMYINYPHTGNEPGTDSYPVYAMGAGTIYMFYREQVEGRPDYDYQVYMDNTCSVTSRIDHLHALSARIQDYLTSTGAQWRDMFGMGTGPWLLMLGQPNGPAMLDVAAGEQLGITKSYSHSWDVGITDKRFVNGTFANPSYTRYPAISDYAAALPDLGIDASVYPFTTSESLNAGCFIEYLSTADGLQASWFDLLLSTPKGCGKVGWDTPGYLRGAWFNPAIDGTPWPAFEIESAALSIIPDNFHPDTAIQIGWGEGSLALLAPMQWSPAWVQIDTTPGATVNPDPAAVGVETTVCYDLGGYDLGGYDHVLFRLANATHLIAKYVQGGGQCAGLESFPPVDETWATFIR